MTDQNQIDTIIQKRMAEFEKADRESLTKWLGILLKGPSGLWHAFVPEADLCRILADDRQEAIDILKKEVEKIQVLAMRRKPSLGDENRRSVLQQSIRELLVGKIFYEVAKERATPSTTIEGFVEEVLIETNKRLPYR